MNICILSTKELNHILSLLRNKQKAAAIKIVTAACKNKQIAKTYCNKLALKIKQGWL